jgi:TRAP-type C4-dicarboxylate transport system permease small subunit
VILAWADRALHVAAAALLVALLATVTAGIVSRGLGHPLSWTDEGSGYLMVWLACFGWMIATRRGAHIRIRYFQDKLPGTAWRWTEAVIQLALAVFGAVIAWNSVHLMRTNADIEAMALPLSVAWMYAPLLPAGLVTLLQGLAALWQQARGQAARARAVPP